MSERILQSAKVSREILGKQIEVTLRHFREELVNNGMSELASDLWDHAYRLNQRRHLEKGDPGVPQELVAFPTRAQW